MLSETLVAPLIDHDAVEGRKLDQYGVLGRIWSIKSVILRFVACQIIQEF